MLVGGGGEEALRTIGWPMAARSSESGSISEALVTRKQGLASLRKVSACRGTRLESLEPELAVADNY